MKRKILTQTLDHSVDFNSISTACFHFILATVVFLTVVINV